VQSTLEDLDDILQGPCCAILQHALEKFDLVRQQGKAGSGARNREVLDQVDADNGAQAQ
jgi:hypothetical protein